MTQPSTSSLEDLHTRWGPPPPTLDAATITYICNGLTLERNSSVDLGLRRRQGWKMAQQVLTEVAAVLVPTATAAPPSPEPPAEDDHVHTPLPQSASTAAGHMLTYEETFDSYQLLAGDGKKKDYSAYLNMLMTPGPTSKGKKAGSSSSSSSSITTTTTDEDSASASTPTIPSSPLAPIQTTTPTKPPNPTATQQINPPTNSNTNPPTTTNSEEEEKEKETAKTLHPLLLARLNAAWSNLLELDLASRSVEYHVARDLGALRRLRGAALDELLEELVVVRGLGRGGSLSTMDREGGEGGEGGLEDEEGEGEGNGEGPVVVGEGEREGPVVIRDGEEGSVEAMREGEYTAAMRALGAKFGEEGDEEEGEAAVLVEWMSEEARREAEETVDWLDWEGVVKARGRVEKELVERGVLGYESE